MDEMSLLWPFLVFSGLLILPVESIAIEHDMNQGMSKSAYAIRHLLQVVLDPTVCSIVKDSVSMIVEFHSMADVIDEDCFIFIGAVAFWMRKISELPFSQYCV